MLTENQKMYFESHPKKDAFHFTSDGQAFGTLAEARGHANDLVRKKKGTDVVVTVTRAEYLEALPGYYEEQKATANVRITAIEGAIAAQEKALQNMSASDTIASKKMELAIGRLRSELAGVRGNLAALPLQTEAAPAAVAAAPEAAAPEATVAAAPEAAAPTGNAEHYGK